MTDTKEKNAEEQPFNNTEISKDKKEETADKSFFEKLWHLKSNISVEPILAGLVIPAMIARLAVQNLYLDKTCRLKLDFGDEICDALIERRGNYTAEEAAVQKAISNIESWRSIVQTAVPTLIVVFMGAWSDRTGNRKFCILLPIFGEFMVCVANIISVYFFYNISVEITMFAEAFFQAITGGWVTIFLGVFSYISDITDEKSRTFRVGLVNLCLTAGIPVGTALSGILLKYWGYYGVFLTSATIYMLTITYGLIFLKQTTKPISGNNEKTQSTPVLDIAKMVKETVLVAFKKREGKTRAKILLTLLIVAIVYGPSHGERTIVYMFVRYRLRWDAMKYSIYSTYSLITHSLGALFSISVFSKKLGFHDSVLFLISVGSKLIGSIYIAFVYSDLQMFMVPIIEILNATTFTSLRSMMSKLVPSQELGKVNSIFSLVETVGALMFDPTYFLLYSKTVDVFSGAVFLYSAFLTLPPIGMAFTPAVLTSGWRVYLIFKISLYGRKYTDFQERWLFSQHRKETRQKRIDEAIEEKIM